jgi:hypothetical protein
MLVGNDTTKRRIDGRRGAREGVRSAVAAARTRRLDASSHVDLRVEGGATRKAERMAGADEDAQRQLAHAAAVEDRRLLTVLAGGVLDTHARMRIVRADRASRHRVPALGMGAREIGDSVHLCEALFPLGRIEGLA